MNLTEAQQLELLLQVARIVPASDRAEWSRFWKAELWCHRHATHGQTSAGLHGGLLQDALWLRVESCRCNLRGTAMLCLLILALTCTLALLLAIGSVGNWHGFIAQLARSYGRFLFASPLVLLVTFLTASRRAVHNGASRHSAPSQTNLFRLSFFSTKAVLLFLLAYFVGAALCAPVASSFPNSAEFLAVLLYVVFSVVALRWSFVDQEQRCKRCLRLLKAPARIGRPSHNLLEWSGSALECVRGHGVLSVPELETSWHQSSEWRQGTINPVQL